MSLLNDLVATRALIATPDDWCKGVSKDAGGRHCMMGAAEELFGQGSKRTAAIFTALHAQIPAGGSLPRCFNDNPTTRHADIMALFDRAIEAAE